LGVRAGTISLKSTSPNFFVDVEERRKEREEILPLVLTLTLARKHRILWAQIKMHVRKSRKEKIRQGIT